MSVNLQIGNDRLVKAASNTVAAEPTMRTTSRTLESLLLMSNKLRQKAESTATNLEAVPRTKAIEHALVNQNASSTPI